MEVLLMCRICLSTEVSEDISGLKSSQKDNTYPEIMLFCLGIQVKKDFEAGTKLCLACFRKIIAFYNFKLLALKNDAYFKYLESSSIVKSETFLDEDIKVKEPSDDSDDNEIHLITKIKIEDLNNDEDPESCQSDNELLSKIKKIKYKLIPENDKTEENVVKDVKRHNIQVHDASERRYECDQCKRRFATPFQLAKHMSVHTKERPYACDVCDKRFLQIHNLKQHKQHVHDKQRLHLCQFHSKTYPSDNRLQTHLRSHTNERPYQCKECDKAFNSSILLKNHTYTHSEKKEFICKVCNKSLKTSRYLRNHMLTHSREKRWQCNYCDMKFHRSDHRTQHESLIHKKHMLSTKLSALHLSN